MSICLKISYDQKCENCEHWIQMAVLAARQNIKNCHQLQNDSQRFQVRLKNFIS